MTENYIPRIIDPLLEMKLAGKGAVLIYGPKWVGKSTTGAHHSKSSINIGDPRRKEEYIKKAELNPSSILNGEIPRLIDEWQYVPILWDLIRDEVDRRRNPGQFILSGSSTPIDPDEISHSGIGRISRIMMRPMTLFESGDSLGSVSLAELFEDTECADGESKLKKLEDVAYVTCRGGWPQSIGKEKKIALLDAVDYVDTLIEYDLSKVDGMKKDPDRLRRLMRSYARNQGTQTPYSTIGRDIFASEDTAKLYINALKRTFVIEDLPAWNPNLRSNTAIRTTPTRYFSDPSIATASLGIGPGNLISDLNTFGFVFETLCIRDLRVYAESIGGTVYHYRDANGLECDAVIVLGDGRYGLVEIKLGGKAEKKQAVKTLKAFSKKLDTEKMNEPSFKAIITADDPYAYRETEGIFTIPIGCLKD